MGKKWIKVSLFTNDMILCRKGHKDSARKLLHLTNTFNKVADCNIETKNMSNLPIDKQKTDQERYKESNTIHNGMNKK